MSLPAGTSPGKAGENKNIGVRGEEKKKRHPGFFTGKLPSGWSWVVPGGAKQC